jgi:hypothetical protein
MNDISSYANISLSNFPIFSKLKYLRYLTLHKKIKLIYATVFEKFNHRYAPISAKNKETFKFFDKTEHT